jgi:hypothetical protein
MFRHVVLFRVHDGVSDDRVTEAIQSLRSLEALPGVIAWTVALSLDERKGRVIVEDATFADERSFGQFRVHADHAGVAGQMSSIADWWNGDFVIDSPVTN